MPHADRTPAKSPPSWATPAAARAAQRKVQPAAHGLNDSPRMVAQRQQVENLVGAPVQAVGWAGWLLGAVGGILTTTVLHDLYQRYQRYIKPADRTAAHLNAGGIHGQTEDPALNVEQGLDTFSQAHALRSDRQDDTRAHLSPLGSMFSSGLREGHSDIDAILMRIIQTEFPGRDSITEEELEFAVQKATMGATRTRGTITGAARVVGGVADALTGGQ